MNKLRFLAILLLMGSCSIAWARIKKADEAFIEAVKYEDFDLFERLFDYITEKRTFDKALLAAARLGDVKLFNMILPKASHKGRIRASRSLPKHHRKIHPGCPIREITYF